MAGMLSGANTQCGEAKRAESKLEVGLMNFGEQVNRAAELAERLNRVANRIAGSEPEPPRAGQIAGANVPRPVESHLERMHRLFSENAETLERAARVVMRLEETVG